MKKFKLKKHQDVEAIQWDGNNVLEVQKFVGHQLSEYQLTPTSTALYDVVTPCGKITLLPGRWILRFKSEGKKEYTFFVMDWAMFNEFFEEIVEETETKEEDAEKTSRK